MEFIKQCKTIEIKVLRDLIEDQYKYMTDNYQHVNGDYNFFRGDYVVRFTVKSNGDVSYYVWMPQTWLLEVKTFECRGSKCRRIIDKSFDHWCESCYGDPDDNKILEPEDLSLNGTLTLDFI